MKKIIVVLLAIALLMVVITPYTALADEEDDATVYTINDAQGNQLTQVAGRVHVDDEYIGADNKEYKIASVDDANHTAIADFVGDASLPDFAWDDNAVEALKQSGGKKLIAMYSTHSDESYVPEDGTSTKLKDAGIFDVGNALKKELEAKGIEVIYDESTFYPHDAGAYRRSRAVAVDLLKKMPTALIDIHRDAVPAEQYTEEVKGEEIQKVRLFVGRSNPNSKANKEFARKLKAVGDKKHPGLIKDIYIGKGNYNQELYPRSILLEFGTHEGSKKEAINSTAFMADTLVTALFGSDVASAAPEGENQAGTQDGTTTGTGTQARQGVESAPLTQDNKGSGTGIFWVIGIGVLAALIYGFMSTGSAKGMAHKMKRGASEITGGLVGEKPEEEANKTGEPDKDT